jgi:hypothetical protein
MKTRYITVKEGEALGINELPSFSATGSIKGMKEQVYGKDALLVRCGSYIYNCSSVPEIYNRAK